jgi:hypothetical protein
MRVSRHLSPSVTNCYLPYKQEVGDVAASTTGSSGVLTRPDSSCFQMGGRNPYTRFRQKKPFQPSDTCLWPCGRRLTVAPRRPALTPTPPFREVQPEARQDALALSNPKPMVGYAVLSRPAPPPKGFPAGGIASLGSGRGSTALLLFAGCDRLIPGSVPVPHLVR